MEDVKMSFDEMISALDAANGRLLIELPNSKTVEDAIDMIAKVSLSLGEWAQDMEVHNC